MMPTRGQNQDTRLVCEDVDVSPGSMLSIITVFTFSLKLQFLEGTHVLSSCLPHLITYQLVSIITHWYTATVIHSLYIVCICARIVRTICPSAVSKRW